MEFNGQKIVPIQFLKAVLPDPGKLGENYKGQTSIGCRIKGIKDGKERTYYILQQLQSRSRISGNRSSGVSYTTGVPATIGAMMFMQGLWKKTRVLERQNLQP